MYDKSISEASRSALVEICSTLGSQYKDDFVLAGGWVPYFLTKRHFDHCGSKDIDLVFKPNVMRRYESIRKLLERFSYVRDSENPFCFRRETKSPYDGTPHEVVIDLLTEPSGARFANLARIQADLTACIIEGCSLVFDFNRVQKVEGVLPKGGKITASLKTADVFSIMVLKGLALPRLNPKDSYDIYAVAGFAFGSPEKSAEKFKAGLKKAGRNATVRRGVTNILSAFRSEDSYGPRQVELFTGDAEVGRDAYLRVKRFLDRL